MHKTMLNLTSFQFALVQTLDTILRPMPHLSLTLLVQGIKDRSIETDRLINIKRHKLFAVTIKTLWFTGK